MSDKEILAVKFLDNFLYVYQKGIYKIDLTSLKVVAEMDSGVKWAKIGIYSSKSSILTFQGSNSSSSLFSALRLGSLKATIVKKISKML